MTSQDVSTDGNEVDEDLNTTTQKFAAETASPAADLPPSIVNSFNEVNDDGSYTFGYEASDGTFKTETKDSEGNVIGNKFRPVFRKNLFDVFGICSPV